jgi:hypothetical protein
LTEAAPDSPGVASFQFCRYVTKILVTRGDAAAMKRPPGLTG